MQIQSLEIHELGKVEEVRQGIVKISGLPNCIYGQMITIGPEGLEGMVIEFSPNSVLGIVFGDEHKVKVGDTVYSEGKPLAVPVGDNFVGRIVGVLGNPMDTKGDIVPSSMNPVFRMAAGVMQREPISQPFQTGVKIIDLVVPIGKGQRELIVGDRQTGKTSIALDTIINQKGRNVICIYCWIGGSHSAFKKIMQVLQQKKAMDYTMAICASAGSSTAEQYLAPYAAAAMGEYFMYQGKDVLVVFDDLTKHAWVYRQMSLLMERAPGREAYPGDIFFLHSQLVERAGRLKPELGGGTMTFLPIAETLQGDITGYISSNLVSMTDGQIYLNSGLFQEGFKPAIDLGLSVSRIGNKAQCPAIRVLGRGLRYKFVQYLALLRLTRLRTKLSSEATQQLQEGMVLHELLIQENYFPVPLAGEILLFYALERKILSAFGIDKVKMIKADLFDYVAKHNPALIEEINTVQDLTEDMKSKLDGAINGYMREAAPI